MNIKIKSSAKIESYVRDIVAVMCKSPKTFKESKLPNTDVNEKLEIYNRVKTVADSMALQVWSKTLAKGIETLRSEAKQDIEKLNDIIYDGTADELILFLNTHEKLELKDSRITLEDIMVVDHGYAKIMALSDLNKITQEDLKQFMIEQYNYKFSIDESKNLIIKAGLTNKEVWNSFVGLRNVCEYNEIIGRDIIGKIFPKKPFKTDIVLNLFIHGAQNGEELLKGLVYLSKFKTQIDQAEVAQSAIGELEQFIIPHYSSSIFDKNTETSVNLFVQTFKMGADLNSLKAIFQTITNICGHMQNFKKFEKEVKAQIPELKSKQQHTVDAYESELYSM